MEGIAFLTTQDKKRTTPIPAASQKKGIKYARSCYDHVAGYLGITIQEGLIEQGFLEKGDTQYDCTVKGILKFKELGIEIKELKDLKRKFAYPCLDWSERKHHIGGALGAALLKYMLDNDWVRKKRYTRELILTSRGSSELEKKFNIKITTAHHTA